MRLTTDVIRFAAELLGPSEPRTGPDDTDVVLRWFGAQRPPTVLVHLPHDTFSARSAIEIAALGLLVQT